MNLAGDVRPATVVISTRSMEAALEGLPTIATAKVRAILPDQLTVTLTEREPIVAWRIGQDGQDEATGWLVDVDGVAFAPIALASDEELGDGATGSALPAVDDLRAKPLLAVGDRLDISDIDAVRTLGNVTPDLIGSDAPALYLSLEDDDGWVLHHPVTGAPSSATTPRPSRPPAASRYQVQCLGALLKDREALVDGVTLAVSTGHCGTFLKGAPEPIPRTKRTPRPGATHRPNKTPRQ